MKLILLCISVLFFLPNDMSAQELSAHPGFWKVKYYEDNREIDKSTFESKLSTVPKANEYYKSAKSMQIGAFVGSFASGWGLGGLLFGDSSRDHTVDYILIGAGTVTTTIFTAIASKKFREALLTYNQSFDQGIRVTPASRGIGIAVHF